MKVPYFISTSCTRLFFDSGSAAIFHSRGITTGQETLTLFTSPQLHTSIATVYVELYVQFFYVHSGYDSHDIGSGTGLPDTTLWWIVWLLYSKI